MVNSKIHLSVLLIRFFAKGTKLNLLRLSFSGGLDEASLMRQNFRRSDIDEISSKQSAAVHSSWDHAGAG